MLPTYCSIGNGRFTAAVNDVIYRPNRPQTLPPVVYMHSGATDATEAAGVNFPSIRPLLTRIAQLGFTVVAPTQPSASYGSGTQSNTATALGRLKAALDYARNTLGCSNAKAILLGASSGSTAALRYAATYPTEIAAVATVLTVADLSTARYQNLGGNAAGISTAYGVSNDGTTARGGTPLPAGSDPATLTATLAAIPLLLHHSSDDIYWTTGIGSNGTGTACGTSFATATGATVVDVGALGHTDASIAATNLSTLAAFVADHA